jgi:CHASE3 domain sensor protein
VAAAVSRGRPLRRRIVLVLTGLTALLLLASAALAVGQVRMAAAEGRVSGASVPALVAVERLERACADAQAGLRGHLLTGQDALLGPYRRAQRLVGEQEAVLRAALRDDAVALAPLDPVLRAHRQWRDAAERAVEARAQGRPVDPVTEAGLFDELRARTGELRAAVERRAGADLADLAVGRSVLVWLPVAAGLLGLLAAVFAAAGIRRSVGRPLAELVRSVERAADGELDRPITTDGPAELVALAAAADRMREGLLDRRPPAGDPPQPAGPPHPGVLATRVADRLGRVPGLLGVHPDLRIDAAPAGDVPPGQVDELVTALDRALDGLVDTRARLDAMEVEVAVTAREAALSLTARGVVPEEWTSEMRAGGRRLSGTCRIVDLDPELTVVEWSVPLGR